MMSDECGVRNEPWIRAELRLYLYPESGLLQAVGASRRDKRLADLALSLLQASRCSGNEEIVGLPEVGGAWGEALFFVYAWEADFWRQLDRPTRPAVTLRLPGLDEPSAPRPHEDAVKVLEREILQAKTVPAARIDSARIYALAQTRDALKEGWR